jgi:NAD(P)-dependent dehydrogenase (short-subunit alcohol dehydrogenase family)
MMNKLQDKIIIVTGGNGLLGKEIASKYLMVVLLSM